MTRVPQRAAERPLSRIRAAATNGAAASTGTGGSPVRATESIVGESEAAVSLQELGDGSNAEREAIEIVIAHVDDSVRSKLVRVASSLGHSVRGTCQSLPELAAACQPSSPDLIISGLKLVDGDVIHSLVEISERDPTPAIIVTPKDDLASVEEALRDHVMAYLVEPVDEAQIKPTIYLVCERFKQFELLKAENDDLKQTLEDRKLIERAKGILMGQFDLTEEDAFRRLQKMAQSKRTKLAKVAAAVSDTTDKHAK